MRAARACAERAYIALPLLLAAGCGFLVDPISDLTRGGADAGRTDAGGTDAGGTDAGATDARADAAVDGATDCVGASFCATFDDDPDVANGWTLTHLGLSGAVDRDLARYRSPPASFLATTKAAGPNLFAAAALTRQLPAGTKVRVAFSVYPDKIDSTNGPNANIAVILFAAAVPSTGNKYSSVRLFVTPTLVDAREEYDPTGQSLMVVQHPIGAAFGLGAWHRVELDIDRSTRTCRVFLDGPQIQSFGFTGPWDEVGVLETTLGIYYSAAPQTDHRFYFDDVRIDAQ
jgi:hypothetical protein